MEEKLCSKCNKLIDENEDWHIITKEGDLVCMECYELGDKDEELLNNVQ
jgi:hypothetical protein